MTRLGTNLRISLVKSIRVVIVLLLVVLLISVVLNAVFYHRGQQFYLQLNEVRLDPIGLSYYAPGIDQEPAPASNQKRAVFFGDSRAADWTFPFGLEQFQFINRGIGNQTSAQALERFDRHVAPLHPDIVVIQVGVNDLKTIPLFPEQRAAIVAACEANIEQIVDRAHDLGATVILTTIFPLGEVPLDRRLFWSDDVAGAIEEVNVFLRSLEREQVVVFESGTVLADERGLVHKEYSRDLLHLDELGYQALNEELVRVLTSLEP